MLLALSACAPQAPSPPRYEPHFTEPYPLPEPFDASVQLDEDDRILGAPQPVRELMFANLDDDPAEELVVTTASGSGAATTWILDGMPASDGVIPERAATGFLYPDRRFRMEAGDIDGDGRDDLVLPAESGTVLLYDPLGDAVESVLPPSREATAHDLVHLDEDGVLDVLQCSRDGLLASLDRTTWTTVREGRCLGSWVARGRVYTVGDSTSWLGRVGWPLQLEPADRYLYLTIAIDGRELDLRWGDDRLVLGVGKGADHTLLFEPGFQDVVSGDFDGDGFDDLAVEGLDPGRNTVSIFHGPLDEVLVDPDQILELPGPVVAAGMDGGDLDGDGVDELAIALYDDALLIVHLPPPEPR